MPSESDIRLLIQDLDVKFDCTFELDEKGYLDPVVRDVHIDMGKSYLFHEDWITARIMN